MSKISRRSFISGAATIPFAVWFENNTAGQIVRIRPEARTTRGRAMLKIYANAVGKMMNSTPESSPLGWVFQWYTHAVRGDRTKAAEIARIYPTSSPQKALAQEVWNTCQAHFVSANERFFLPWHRMFVFFFEDIIRTVSGDNSFVLPYWNYSAASPTIHGIMPKEFRLPNDPVFKPLFIQKRNVANVAQGLASVNAGEPIDKNDPGALDLDALAECTYLPRGAANGFNRGLDFGLHGNVHVLVGNTLNMGQVPWAAGDPIFWMHHCNIDRLWASWNRGGRQNPTSDTTWMNKKFVFADKNGNRVEGTVKDFLNITALRYTYDRFERVPACPPITIAAAAQTRHTRASGNVSLGAEPVNVELEVEPGVAASTSFARKVRDVKPGNRLYLVINNIRAEAQPGCLYHIYIDLPSGAEPRRNTSHKLGVINFFDAASHGEHTADPKSYSWDVTRIAKALQQRGRLKAKPTLRIVPFGQPEANARPVVGDISFVEQKP